MKCLETSVTVCKRTFTRNAYYNQKIRHWTHNPQNHAARDNSTIYKNSYKPENPKTFKRCFENYSISKLRVMESAPIPLEILCLLVGYLRCSSSPNGFIDKPSAQRPTRFPSYHKPYSPNVQPKQNKYTNFVQHLEFHNTRWIWEHRSLQRKRCRKKEM